MGRENETSKGKISIIHFIYLCALLIIGTIALVSIIFGDSERAGENLNFAATLVSIILAVIAILYTLFDSSNQKNNVNELKRTAESLADSIEQEKILLIKLQDELESISALKDELTSQIFGAQQWREELEKKLNNIIETQPGEQTNLQELKKLVQESSLNSSINIVNKSFPSKRERYIFMLDVDFNEHDDSDLDDFINYLNKQFEINNIRYKLRGWTQINRDLKIETYSNTEENMVIKKVMKNYPNVKLLTIYKQSDELLL